MFTLPIDSTIIDALKKLEELSYQSVMAMFVVDKNNKVQGSVTAGDIRRALIGGCSLRNSINEVMNPNYTYLEENHFDFHKLLHIKQQLIKIVPVLDKEGKLVEILNFETHKSFIPVDAVLMAGGKGERLRPMTLTTPKPLLLVGDRPIIDYNIDNLLLHGINRIYVTTNYLADQVEKHFENPMSGVIIDCVREPKYLGTMGSVKFIKTWKNDTVLVMNSDLFTNIDLENFYLHFKEQNADMSIAAVPYSVSLPYGIFEIRDNHQVNGIHEKPSYHYYANAGIYLFKKHVIDLIPDDTFFNATDLLNLLISERKKVTHFPISGYWIDIGNPDDFKKVQDIAQHIPKYKHIPNI